MILVTGGAGFIGSNFVLDWLATENTPVVNLDKLTYAGNLNNLSSLEKNSRHIFQQGDICDRGLLRNLLKRHEPRAIIHFAAESHVDRSILGPENFIQTNVVGTFHLLEEARAYWQNLDAGKKNEFRFLHVSTDEVYGSLGTNDQAFNETTPYSPNSPYAASKAAADHLVRAYHRTYGFPTLTTNCSNNYGPLQFPEKLVPLMILNALQSKALPVYGDGKHIRDWLYVGDHCAAIRMILAKGKPGETYNIGCRGEKNNIEVVRMLCAILDELNPLQSSGKHIKHETLITYVADRPGHDRRYAIDPRKVETATGWRPKQTFESGLRKTVQWYLDNMAWVNDVTSGNYKHWIAANYGQRTKA